MAKLTVFGGDLDIRTVRFLGDQRAQRTGDVAGKRLFDRPDCVDWPHGCPITVDQPPELLGILPMINPCTGIFAGITRLMRTNPTALSMFAVSLLKKAEEFMQVRYR
jgi:hypothetical protein